MLGKQPSRTALRLCANRKLVLLAFGGLFVFHYVCYSNVAAPQTAASSRYSSASNGVCASTRSFLFYGNEVSDILFFKCVCDRIVSSR